MPYHLSPSVVQFCDLPLAGKDQTLYRQINYSSTTINSTSTNDIFWYVLCLRISCVAITTYDRVLFFASVFCCSLSQQQKEAARNWTERTQERRRVRSKRFLSSRGPLFLGSATWCLEQGRNKFLGVHAALLLTQLQRGMSRLSL